MTEKLADFETRRKVANVDVNHKQSKCTPSYCEIHASIYPIVAGSPRTLVLGFQSMDQVPWVMHARNNYEWAFKPGKVFDRPKVQTFVFGGLWL
jgi:hypothetical protein